MENRKTAIMLGKLQNSLSLVLVEMLASPRRLLNKKRIRALTENLTTGFFNVNLLSSITKLNEEMINIKVTESVIFRCSQFFCCEWSFFKFSDSFGNLILRVKVFIKICLIFYLWKMEQDSDYQWLCSHSFVHVS